MLEFYRGFNKKPNGEGRYAKLRGTNPKGEPSEYYGITLVKTWPLDELHKKFKAKGDTAVAKIVKEMNKACGR